MSKQKILNLTKYVSDMKNRLTAPLPEKHKDHEKEYKQFLNNEVQMANGKLEALKLAGQDAKK